MKIMFVSDIHGSKANLRKIKDIYDKEGADIIFFLGDIFYGSSGDTKEIEDLILSFPNRIVIKGNCDSVSDVFSSNIDFVDYYYFKAFDKVFFCSHGNVYNVKKFPDNKEFDVMVYGHTHTGRIFKDGLKYFLNPGSISFPRNGSANSYLICDDNGAYLKSLDRIVLDKIMW